MNSIPAVQFVSVTKEFGRVVAVRDLNLEIEDGEFFSLLGPSGCGKTTTLRMIGGLEIPSDGEVFIAGEPQGYKPPFQRPVNTVFQNYALFPHMTVYDNVAFGLEMQKVEKAEIRERVFEALEMVQLQGMENRKPKQLSGGQQQRVALARALINQPKVLLLDEPLGALDLKLRKAMQLELKALQERVGITFVYVTHDQEEALTMSDRIGVMNEGDLLQVGTPKQVYEAPETSFVADFIGDTNYLDGKMRSTEGEFGQAVIGDGILVHGTPVAGIENGDPVQIAFRPEKLRFKFEVIDLGDHNQLQCEVVDIVYTGSFTMYLLECPNGNEITIRKQNRELGDVAGLDLNIGDQAEVVWPFLMTKIFAA
jgi:spermidine/putrescine transport system ATP-binding protein